MGVKEFKLPDVGEGVAEGELVSWLVEVGDTVTEDQAVAEVETDKALVEVPSPYNGTVKELLAEEGEMVPVGNVIITFEVEGEGDEPTDEERTSAEMEAQESEADERETGDEAIGAAGDGEAVAGESPEKGADGEAETPKGRVFAAPSARRLARELDVDINAVEGSGPGGRVTDADVQTAANGQMESEVGEPESESDSGPREVSTGEKQSAVSRRDGQSAVNGSAGAAASAEAAGRDRTLAAPATRRMAEEEGVDIDDVPTDETRDGEAFVTAEAVTQYAQAQREAREAEMQAESAETEAEATSATNATAEGVAERIPYRGVRRTIGQQMEQSAYTAPHVTHHDTTTVDELVDVRAEYKQLAAERDVKLTYMPFVMKAIVAGLREHPILNSTLDESDPENAEILVRNEYNIGIAVATDAGLMVPVVKNVDKKSILQLSREVNDLASRARERKVTREEMQGGTFTITNFGAIGGEYATPIINYPETAILGLGGIEKRPVVEETEEGDEVVAANTLPLSLSIDHRVVDGADAAAFTNTVMEYLRNPKLLLLE
ncbi:dihydrolipoamide acetyltransferase family protein [Haloprofundus salilacus]|uniref:dihydrolipoamide acetyltransferase family protein n=1 Tax=Haloprofundus salilacus TaxID=2876190 RepID=UPI001CCF06ED|nr:dihydrolipoamide acetyltransferase family protein [Haloprofundus salilacus]